MNAQEIVAHAIDRDEENMRVFYPTLYIQKKTNENITKCLRDLK